MTATTTAAPAVTETVVRFGPGQALVGVVTAPAARAGAAGRAPLGVVLLNAGIIHRVGPHRLHVKIARALAALGCAAVRFDFSGIGDSRARDDHLPFEESSVHEARAAMDLLARLCGCARFLLVGLCSGAVIACRAGARDPRVAGVLLVNPQAYGQDVKAYAKARRSWRAAVADPRRWLRVLTGGARYGRVAARLRGLVAHRRRARAAAPRFAADFEALAARGADVRVLLTPGDLGRECLEVVLGDRLRALCAAGALRVETLAEGDHTCTRLAAQRALLERVERAARALAGGA